MNASQQDIYQDDISNPLDGVEEIMQSRDWAFDRPTPDELMVQVAGQRGCYNLTFIWQEDFSALQFFCEIDLHIREERLVVAGQTLRDINEEMWLGHFDIPAGTQAPCFRHTTLFRGLSGVSGVDHIRDLVEIGIAECERYYNAFSLLSGSSYLDKKLLDLALVNTEGCA